jgi:hypothetical protein
MGVLVVCCHFCTCCWSKVTVFNLCDDARVQGAAGSRGFWGLAKSWAGREGGAAAQVFTTLIVLCFPLFGL